jgi:hypothetical protein
MLVRHSLRALILAGGIAVVSLAATQTVTAAEPFTLKSSAFNDGTPLQTKNAGDLKKIRIALEIAFHHLCNGKMRRPGPRVMQ